MNADERRLGIPFSIRVHLRSSAVNNHLGRIVSSSITARSGSVIASSAHAAASGMSSGETDLFIYPGYEFQVVDRLLTNFHLPKSTLLMLVCAFAGRDTMLRAYRHAVEQRYRFFSYGDAMLIER